MLAPLHEMAAHVPEARDGGAQAKLGARGGRGPEERERRSEVVVVAGEGVQRAGFADGRLEPLGKRQEVLRVAAALSRRARRRRSVARARTRAPSRAWRSVARRRRARSWRTRLWSTSAASASRRGAADRFGGIQRAAAREHRQPGEQRPLTAARAARSSSRWWRAASAGAPGESRAPAVSRSRRCSSRASIVAGSSSFARAAASSSASGSPSTRRRCRRWRRALPSVSAKSGRTACERATNSATASLKARVATVG